LATAKAFATEGCRVMLSARSIKQLREAETVLRTTGAEVAAHAGDVGNPDHARGLIRATVAAFGGIDILVNNVGGGGGDARIADSTDDDWRGALEWNLVQTVRMMRLAFTAPARPTRRCGHQYRVDLRLVAPARDVRPIRRGEGGAAIR